MDVRRAERRKFANSIDSNEVTQMLDIVKPDAGTIGLVLWDELTCIICIMSNRLEGAYSAGLQ